jgi:hypothetical protein
VIVDDALWEFTNQPRGLVRAVVSMQPGEVLGITRTDFMHGHSGFIITVKMNLPSVMLKRFPGNTPPDFKYRRAHLVD